MLFRVLMSITFSTLFVFFLISVTPAWSEQVWDDELNRYLTREEMMQEDVYLTNEAAARLMFPDSEEIFYQVHTFTPDEKQLIESRIKWKFPEQFFEVFIGKSKGKVDGWAVVQHTIGKHKPMSYMVGIDPEGEVMNVEVLVYRESRGSEVRTKRFNYQYEGKDVHDPIRINRDVINISGATMSVRSMSAGVKRALVFVDEIYMAPLGLHSGLTAKTQDEKNFFEEFLGF